MYFLVQADLQGCARKARGYWLRWHSGFLRETFYRIGATPRRVAGGPPGPPGGLISCTISPHPNGVEKTVVGQLPSRRYGQLVPSRSTLRRQARLSARSARGNLASDNFRMRCDPGAAGACRGPPSFQYSTYGPVARRSLDVAVTSSPVGAAYVPVLGKAPLPTLPTLPTLTHR